MGVVDVIDQNRVLLDGPCSGVKRQAYRIKNLHMTPLVTKFPFSARSKVVRTAWENDGITKKWEESAWAKRMLMKAKSARNKILAKAVNIKKKKMSKAGKL